MGFLSIDERFLATEISQIGDNFLAKTEQAATDLVNKVTWRLWTIILFLNPAYFIILAVLLAIGFLLMITNALLKSIHDRLEELNASVSELPQIFDHVQQDLVKMQFGARKTVDLLTHISSNLQDNFGALRAQSERKTLSRQNSQSEGSRGPLTPTSPQSPTPPYTTEVSAGRFPLKPSHPPRVSRTASNRRSYSEQ